MQARVTIWVLAVMALVFAISSVGGSGGAGPPGIDADSWRSINDDLGILIQHGDAGMLRGTLMTRVDRQWLPIAIIG